MYIHDGGFTSGSSGSQRHNGANFVAVGDVILVTINFRVSVLGFLSTGNKTLKGNLGLYDQRLAMKWVKDNIASFGGNPKSITLFGLGSGAACASAHTLSENSWPYFDRVILQSGTTLMPWSTLTLAQLKAVSAMFLKAVNCTIDGDLKCLKNNVNQDVLNKLYTTTPFSLEYLWFALAVDAEFLKDDPYKLLKSGQVKQSSIMLGVTKDEMFFYNNNVLQTTRNISVITDQFKNIVKTHFKDKSEKVNEYALKLYTPKCTPTFIEAFRPIVDSITDHSYTCGMKQEAVIRSANSSKVYLYRYSYATPVPYSAYPQGLYGFAAHGTDFLSVFGIPINNAIYPAEDQILSMRVILYWTNFAKTGDPNSGTTTLPLVLDNVDTLPNWPPHSSNEQEFLNMESLSQMLVAKKIREKYCKFLMDPDGETARHTISTASRNTVHSLLLGLVVLYNIL